MLAPVVVQIEFSPDFVIELTSRVRSLSLTRKIFSVATIITICVCGVVAILAFVLHQILVAISWAIFGAVLLLSLDFDRWLQKRQLRRSPFINEVLELKFSNLGLHAVSPSQDVKFAWKVFTKMIRFDDGFLLMQGPGLCNWIPFDCILGNDGAERLLQLLESHIACREDRRTKR